MKDRILKNWTVLRIFYLLIGGVILIQSVSAHEWLGLAIGGYFAAMGIFAFGCAAGACGYTPRGRTNT